MFNHNLKETYYAFPLACYIGSGAYKKILKAKKVKSTNRSSSLAMRNTAPETPHQ